MPGGKAPKNPWFDESGNPVEKEEPRARAKNARAIFAQWEEGLDEREKKETKIAKEQMEASADDWNARMERAKEMQQIQEATAAVEKETARIGMDGAELITDLEKERVSLLEQAAKWEKDIFGIHNKDAALARQRAAELQQRIQNVERNIEPQTFTNSPRGRKFSKEEEAAMDMKDRWGAFKNFRTGPFGSSATTLKTGGLTTGSLDRGNSSMSDAYGKIRRGDAARAKKAAKEQAEAYAEAAAKADDPTVENTAKLVEIWGGTGQRK